MMSVDITREELYELVWSMPLVHAAKQFNISDVMLGRICNNRNIPRPPRGYWVSLQSASQKKLKRFTKPPLPSEPEPEKNFNNLMEKEYQAREAARTDVFNPWDLNDPVRPEPSPITESIEEFKVRIDSIFTKLIEPEELTKLHPIVQKVLDQDLIVANKRKRDSYAPDPRYQNEKGKMYLALLNLFITNFEALGFSVSLQGRIHFAFHVRILNEYKEFHAFINEHEPTLIRRKRFGEKKRKTYCFSWSREYESNNRGRNHYDFEELSSSCVRQVVMELVMKKEKEYREYLFRSYRDNVEYRKRAIENREREIKRAEEQKRKALAELLANREHYMAEAVAKMNHADKIRELIEVMQLKAESKGQVVKGFERWLDWATHHANSIDPRCRSLEGFEAWIDKFDLKH